MLDTIFDELTAVEKIGLNYLVRQTMAAEAAKRNRAALAERDDLLSNVAKRLTRFETNSKRLLAEVSKLAPAEAKPEDAPAAELVCKSYQDAIERAEALAGQHLKPDEFKAELMKIHLEKQVDTPPRSFDDVLKAAAFIAKTKQGDDLKQSLLRL